MNSSTDMITFIIPVHIPVNIDSLTQLFQCIIRDLFLDVTTKLKPLGLLVETFPKLVLHVHVGKFNNNLGVSTLLQIFVDSE